MTKTSVSKLTYAKALEHASESAIVSDKAERELAEQQARAQKLAGREMESFLRVKWVERTAPFLRAIADGTRLKILDLLASREPWEVGELATELKVRPSTMSQHLAMLREARIVIMEKQGIHTKCFINRGYVVWRLRQIGEQIGP